MSAEEHKTSRIGWLRAVVLGANDGLISTSSLVVGVASAAQGQEVVLVAAVAGLTAGAISMAAGEYVSVSSQQDTEKADLAKELRELATEPEKERQELTDIYVKRGLTRELAGQVADQLSAADSLGAHARDELGLNEQTKARPLQAALASAASFAVGAAPAVLLAALLPPTSVKFTIIAVTLGLLLVLGAVAARLGDASMVRGAVRVTFWGAVAMGGTSLIGGLFGTTV